MAMKMRRKSLMSFETTRKAIGVMVVLASLFLGQAAYGQTPTQAAKRDLSNYATIIAGYHIDIRGRVLNKRQRSDYLEHMQVIRHAFEKKGLSPYLLDQIEDNARAAGRPQY